MRLRHTILVVLACSLVMDAVASAADAPIVERPPRPHTAAAIVQQPTSLPEPGLSAGAASTGTTARRGPCGAARDRWKWDVSKYAALRLGNVHLDKGGVVWPLCNSGRVGQGPYNDAPGATHQGQWQDANAYDIVIRHGSAVRAVTDGTIDRRLYGPLQNTEGRFAGRRLYLRTGHRAWYYAHLHRITIPRGARVRKGQIIGYSGTAAGVPHLHIAASSGDLNRLFRLR